MDFNGENILSNPSAFIGTTSGHDLRFKSRNVFSGFIGERKTAFGMNSLVSNTSGIGNSAYGYYSLKLNTTGTSNDAFGEFSLFNNVGGGSNSAFGNISLRSNTSGNSNAAFGLASLSSNTTGNGNSAFGVNSMMIKGAGEFNSSFGFDSFRNLQSGSHNIGIGYNAGGNQQNGNRNIAIGSEVNLPNSTGSNQLNIGNWIYGINGDIGIGTITPNAKLEIRQEGNSNSDRGLLITEPNNSQQIQLHLADNNAGEYGFFSLGGDTKLRGNGQDSSFDGDVGIGTTTPSSRLEVNSEVSNTSGLKFTQLNSSTPVSEGIALGVDAEGNVVTIESSTGGATSRDAWSLEGNTGTDDAENFIGTTDAQDLVFKTDNSERLRISQAGRIEMHGLGASTGVNHTHNLYIGGGNDIVQVVGANGPFSAAKNTAVGMGSMVNITSENHGANTAVGTNSLNKLTTGDGNTALGVNALQANTTGQGNVALGLNALNGNQTGEHNTSVGYGNSPFSNRGDRNISIGALTTRGLLDNSDDNITIGFENARVVENMSRNIVIGKQSLYKDENGISISSENLYDNIVIGNNIALAGNSSNRLSIGDWIIGNNGVIGIGDFDTELPSAADASSDTENNYRLFVKDGIRTEKLRVDVSGVNGWADYVFEKDYDLPSLEKLEKYITKHKHLPNIPSTEEVVKEGLEITEYSAKLLEKVEELTLYSIQLNKENKSLKSKALDLELSNKRQQKLLEALLKRVELLEKKESK